MNKRSIARGIVVGALLSVAVSLPFTIHTSSAPQEKPIELSAKNIQVLKGMPESQLMPTMHLMRTALGVKCEFCHVAVNGKYWMDDKPQKQTARRMIQMVFDINKANFGGEPVVTCNTCHRGSTKPVGVPAIGQAAFDNPTRTDPSEIVAAPALPPVEEILNKYTDAVGGKRAVEQLQTRVTEATLMRPKLVNPSGKPTVVEIYQKAPNKLLWVMTGADGTVVYQGYNGKIGWVKGPTFQRELTPSELPPVLQQANFYKELNLKDQFPTLKVIAKEKVGERDAYLLEGVNSNGYREKLYFDTETGLLVRRVLYNKTVLGPDPLQTDYLDYKEVDGVKLPFTIQTSYLDNSHLNTTRKFSQIKHNVPVDDAKFDPPSK
ncbi:MAG TPA: c-type cytochrome [Pyrinomonadaceae bacterium]